MNQKLITQLIIHKNINSGKDDKKICSVVDQEIINSLKESQHQNLFQKEILYYLAKLCTDKEITKLKKAFSAIDKDNSGEIEYEEIPKIFNELGIKATDVSFYNFLIFIFYFV